MFKHIHGVDNDSQKENSKYKDTMVTNHDNTVGILEKYEIPEGSRVIKMSRDKLLDSLKVIDGDNVLLILEKSDYPLVISDIGNDYHLIVAHMNRDESEKVEKGEEKEKTESDEPGD